MNFFMFLSYHLVSFFPKVFFFTLFCLTLVKTSPKAEVPSIQVLIHYFQGWAHPRYLVLNILNSQGTNLWDLSIPGWQDNLYNIS